MRSVTHKIPVPHCIKVKEIRHKTDVYKHDESSYTLSSVQKVDPLITPACRENRIRIFVRQNIYFSQLELFHSDEASSGRRIFLCVVYRLCICVMFFGMYFRPASSECGSFVFYKFSEEAILQGSIILKCFRRNYSWKRELRLLGSLWRTEVPAAK